MKRRGVGVSSVAVAALLWGHGRRDGEGGLARRIEGGLLQMEDLLEGGDAGITDSGDHGGIVSTISDERTRWDVDSGTAFVMR